MNDMKKCPIVQALHIKILTTYFQLNPRNYVDRLCSANWKVILKDCKENEQLSPEDIESLLVVCEHRLENIVSRHSSYVMLFWSRRLAPWNIFDVAPETIALYRDVLALSVYKYGKQTDCVPYNGVLVPCSLYPYVETMGDDGMSPDALSTWPVVVNEINAVIETECVAYIYVRLTQLYRWAAKEASVRLKDGSLQVEASDELTAQVALYDQRIKNVNILSPSGDWFQNRPASPANTLPVPSLNTKRDGIVDDIVVNQDKSITRLKMQDPNYVYAAFNLKKFGQYIEKYATEIQYDYGFTPKEFIIFLRALNMALIIPAHTTIHQCRDLNYCAYIVRRTYTDDPLNELTELLMSGCNRGAITRDRMKVVVKYFMSPAGAGNHTLDLWTRQPKKLIYQLSPHWWAFDLSHLIYPIHDVMRLVAERTGATATVRGNSFEESVVEVLGALYGLRNMWVCRQHIQNRDRTKEREVDASVVIKGTLFVIEAKAMKFSADLDCGKPKVLKNRRRTLQRYLKQVDETAQFIAENKDCLNMTSYEGNATIPFPANVRRICPILVTAFPEFIWNMHPDKFLDSKKELPRVMTIDDFPKLRSLKTSDLDTCPFVIRIR